MMDAGMTLPARAKSASSLAAAHALDAETIRVDEERHKLQEEARQLELRTAAVLHERTKTVMIITTCSFSKWPTIVI